MSGTLTNEEHCLQLWIYLTLWLHPRGSLKKHDGSEYVITFKIYIDAHADAREQRGARLRECTYVMSGLVSDRCSLLLSPSSIPLM